MKKFIPVGEKCLVLPKKQENKTKSGIILPDATYSPTHYGKFLSGVVRRMGTIPSKEIHERDVVLYNGGIKETVEDVEYDIVNYSDIIAVIGQ